MPLRRKSLERKTKNSTFDKALDFIRLSDEIKKLERIAELKKLDLKKLVEKKGYENADGHFSLDVTQDGETITLQNTCRVGMKLKVNALEIIEKKFKRQKSIYTEKITIVRDDIVRSHLEKGKLSKERAMLLYDLPTNYAFSAKVAKEEITERTTRRRK